MTPGFWRNRRVVLTGHTGFKGAWLAFCLRELGAEVAGIALPPNSTPSLFETLQLDRLTDSHLFDIADQDRLAEVIAAHRAEVVLHLAAQALVRRSYGDPVATFATNVVGTVSVLNAVRAAPAVKSVVVVTSDKCYENHERPGGYRETDQLGGRDPYSASKGCAEIATHSMRRSFFAPYLENGHAARIATVRTGNVIGGGDWSDDRLVPDLVRGCLGPAGQTTLRYPDAVRPWQHVLDPTFAYLELAERLAMAPDTIDDAWNIGPEPSDTCTVIDLAQRMVDALGTGRIVVEPNDGGMKETNILQLDCGKAKAQLGWAPRLRLAEAIDMTVGWYSAWAEGDDMVALTRRQIATYRGLAADTAGRRLEASGA